MSDEAKAEMKVRVLKGITGRIVGERRDAYYMDYSSGKDDVYICIPADEAREFLEAVEGIAEHTKIWELRDKARALLATLPEK